MAISTMDARNALKNMGNTILHAASDLLSSSDFVSRTIGMNNSYDDIMFIVQLLGREPISLLGKDYVFIYDHARRIYQQGVTVASTMYGGGNYWCPKFTFYKEKPTIKFADVDSDPLNLIDRWMPNMHFGTTKSKNINFSYAESNDDSVNNKTVSPEGATSPGTASGQQVQSFTNLSGCDLLRKTNENFVNGKFRTLIARFHTNSMDSRDPNDPTQTAISNTYGMSHGRNLLKLKPDEPNGYDNPYCRVWTYHHQYHRLADAIRPFGDKTSADSLESAMMGEHYGDGGFRTIGNQDFGGGSTRLDQYGVLNYENGMVNIAPTAKVTDYFNSSNIVKDKKIIQTKKCMFSIENLAWRDIKAKINEYQPTGTSPEQRGPLGGRIMWFPPYDLEFSENVSVKWNPNEFIGRGENIYTYTNTERRGTLSFTMVIDHPSVLDYWTGHERNGMKQKGKDLLPGNEYGVDGIEPLNGKNNQEQTLLRFFAGCEVLTAKPQEYTKGKTTEQSKDEKKPEDNVLDDKLETPPTSEGEDIVCCVVYFPNNYSGIDDSEKGNKINPIYYLMNGIGCQEYIDENPGSSTFLESVPLPTSENKIKVFSGEVVDNEAECKTSQNKCDEACDENGVVTTWTEVEGMGGYEVVDQISPFTVPLKNDTDVRKRTFACLGTGVKGQYLTSSNGKFRYAVKGDGGEYYTLSKIIGKKAESYKNDMTGNEWLRRRLYYRVDRKYDYQWFEDVNSYIDTRSSSLNGYGFDFRIGDKIAKPYISSDYIHEDTKLVSFSDFFAVVDKKQKIFNPSETDDIRLIKNLRDKAEGFKIKEVIIQGNASKAGRTGSNNTLAHDRAETVRRWLSDNDFPKPANGDYTIKSDTQDNKNHVNIGGSNEYDQKVWRSATIIIKYEKSAVQHATQTDASTTTSGTVDNEDGTKRDAELSKTDTLMQKPDGGSKTIRQEFDEFIQTTEGAQFEMHFSAKYQMEYGINPTRDDLLAEYERWKDKEKTEVKDGEAEDDTKTKTEDNKKEKNPIVTRYDNEGEFFETLNRTSPFLHHLITEKIKYFDPAYHAISPEGFNARLTFLHQCTRQGNTMGSSDNRTVPAYNLAFGRPPVCVLRLGDFYYTKIIINSLTINYENSQWDLNPEGIGVMPMFAKITMDFNFIGGSDLAGPIARLQNAVSFNYYANTGVYDDRAEMVEYDPSGSGKEIKYKPFVYMSGEEEDKK